MAATLSLRNLKAVAASRPAVARSRTAVRVQAFQVTMKTPEGTCKKFELEAGKDLLEVSRCLQLFKMSVCLVPI